MGAEGELWDDFALIDAFDNAMSKNKMHGKKTSEANVSVVLVDQTGDEATKQRDAGEDSNATLNIGTEMDERKDLQLVKENDGLLSKTR